MKTLQSLFAVLLAFLVLVSSSSFMIGLHVCMGEVQNVAFLSKAEGCEKEKNLPPCHRHIKPPCCEDEVVIHKADDLKASVSNIKIIAPALVIITQPGILISNVLPFIPTIHDRHYNYDPPLPPCDITLEQQVFLI